MRFAKLVPPRPSGSYACATLSENHWGWTVIPAERLYRIFVWYRMKTDGVVLCNQPRTLDISARRGKRINRAPDSVIDQILAALQDILE